MHSSKWQIWDFFNTQSNGTILRDAEGIIALNTFDPVCLKMVKDFLVRNMGERTLHYKLASEVSRPWLEEEFQTLSLFGNTESFFIHQANDFNAEMIDTISSLDVSGRFLLLSYENEQASWKKTVKDGKLSTLVIEPPRFWEFNKLLDFVCSYLRLPLSFDAKAWILEALENNLTTFYNSCCLIKLNFPDAREVSLSDVKSLLTLEKLDQFALASLLSRKKHKDFFEKLVQLEGDFDKMRAFFMFLQSHLVKMADPTYLSGKARLTQYDKDIQNASRLWRQEELVKEIQLFNRWEILSKKKDSSLWHELKLSYLRSLQGV